MTTYYSLLFLNILKAGILIFKRERLVFNELDRGKYIFTITLFIEKLKFYFTNVIEIFELQHKESTII